MKMMSAELSVEVLETEVRQVIGVVWLVAVNVQDGVRGGKGAKGREEEVVD